MVALAEPRMGGLNPPVCWFATTEQEPSSGPRVITERPLRDANPSKKFGNRSTTSRARAA